jgi:hypothetical protein
MLLIPAVVLTGLGFLTWAAGMAGDYTGLAALGAILVVGVGGMVLTDGLEREAGTIERTINSSTTETIPKTTSIDLLPQTPTGAVWMLIGGAMLLQGLNPND